MRRPQPSKNSRYSKALFIPYILLNCSRTRLKFLSFLVSNVITINLCQQKINKGINRDLKSSCYYQGLIFDARVITTVIMFKVNMFCVVGLLMSQFNRLLHIYLYYIYHEGSFRNPTATSSWVR